MKKRSQKKENRKIRRRRKKSQNVDGNKEICTSRKGKKHMSARKRKKRRKDGIGKKDEQEAGKIAISDLLLGGRACFIWY